MPINVRIVGSWLAELTILHIAAPLESVSPVREAAGCRDPLMHALATIRDGERPSRSLVGPDSRLR